MSGSTSLDPWHRDAAQPAQVRPRSGAGLSRACWEEGPRAPRSPRPEPTVLPRAVAWLCPLPSLQPRATFLVAGPAPPVLAGMGRGQAQR